MSTQNPNDPTVEHSVDEHKVSPPHRPIEFTIDGRVEVTTVYEQRAADLLRLVHLDPARYDLGQLHGHSHQPTRFRDEQIVRIHESDRFVSIRQHADVA